MLTEAQTIYYGLQTLVAYMPDKLGPDKLFSVRTVCVPVEEWTGPMWYEAARIVGVHRKALTESFGDPGRFDTVAAQLGKPPIEQALVDARAATPRPTDQQLAEVQALAEELKAQRQYTRPRYDVELTPDLGFARLIHIPRDIIQEAGTLPGFWETEKGEHQVWLSSELRDFIISHNLNAHPYVLPAIATEVARIEETVPWGLVLEKASSCKDPADYPAKLLPVLRAMNVKGIEWTT